MVNNIKLPKGWKLVKLGDVANYVNGRAFKPNEWEKEGIPIIRIQNLNNQNSKYNYAKKGFEEKYKVVNGDLLFAWSASLGAYIWKGNDAWLNQHIFKVVPKVSTNTTYLFYLLEKIVQELYSKAHGSGMVHVTKGKFEATEIPLPPLLIQHAIVSKIEELFSELDKGIENLRTAQQQLKTYRQAVLKWAFEGKLTNEYVKDGELPEGWKWVKLGGLMESVRNGYSKKPDEIGQYKILRISSVRPNKVDLNEVRFIEKEIGVENSLSENDLLFTRYNGSIDFVGVCGMVPNLKEILFYPDKLIRCRPIIKEKFHSAYIDYAANSRLARQFILSKIKTTAGQTGISGSDIKEIPIPLSPKDEQLRIVQEIESRLSVADKMEESINQSLLQAEALRQSILKKAFEGKLI